MVITDKRSAYARTGLNVPYAVSRPDRIRPERYYDNEFFEMEKELLWPRVWQMAARLEYIPNPGDFIEYEILDQSVIVVRVDANTVKAYENACRHRAVKLIEGAGHSDSGFVCPFHGWCYGIDGSNTFLYQPDLYDPANIEPHDVNLVEIRCETWGGSAFINFDNNAPSLRETLGPFGEIGDIYLVEDLRSEWWLAAHMPTNWKLSMEAFMEGYHVLETHPQLIPPNRSQRQGAVYRPLEDENRGQVRRMNQIAGQGSIDKQAFIDAQIHFMKVLSEGMAGMTHANDIRIAEGLRGVDLPSDPTEAVKVWRHHLNEAVMTWHRARGERMPELNEIEKRPVQGSVAFMFPHYFLLPTYSSASSYRIRPLTPETCLFELWSLTRFPPGQEPTPPAKPTPMPPDHPSWPPIPMQDYSNLPAQQKGLHARNFEYMRLSNSVEGMIGNYHRLIDGYLSSLGDDQLTPAREHVNGFIDMPLKDIGF